ncbi:DJ-1/PfpI family protein [Candidatus Halocynthiibacter alkanivorans]|uniref:DJ-1/PfpI family protein n=1 Tax=Candidatus Halocynthiibacter alkanivorans TaxID=2267619 RepID=UPI000DF298FA|nr:DJ-1/PfpI family protein [Candidatus Halocynthiibacter alkanivorans]
MKKKKVGIYLFPHMTMMDAYAPLQFFAMVEEFETFTFAKTSEPLMSDAGALLVPNYGFEDCPDIDVLVVPGGGNTLAQMQDTEVVDFIRAAGEKAEYVTSVCTGALILAEAGLLHGHRAATHWAYREVLKCYSGIELVDERVCIDRNRITGGGITAGLDFALTVIAEVINEPTAHVMQLLFEYRPAPPFNSGGPETAPEFAVQAVRGKVAELAADLWAHANSKKVA